PTTGSGAETVTSTTGRPSTTLWRTETSSAYRGDSAAPISARVRAAPSCGPRSARPATRAPSAAQSTRVARTCTASATWTTPRNSTSTRTATRVKSTTADPRSGSSRMRQGPTTVTSGRADTRDRVAERLRQRRTRDGPQRDDQARGHEGDEDPARDVAPFPVAVDEPHHHRPDRPVRDRPPPRPPLHPCLLHPSSSFVVGRRSSFVAGRRSYVRRRSFVRRRSSHVRWLGASCVRARLRTRAGAWRATGRPRTRPSPGG